MVNTFDDLTGLTFGLMTVIRKAPPGRGTTTQWECRCGGCGATVIQRRDHLRRGKFARCHGHVRRGKGNRTSTRPHGFSAATEVFGIYRRRARLAGRDFALDRDQFLALAAGDCHYCGSPPTQIWGNVGNRITRHLGAFTYNGIDRIDSARGYTADNCVSCCGRCNSMKSDMSVADFLAHVRRVAAHGTASQ